MNIENLKILANYLESGKLEAGFDMRSFSEGHRGLSGTKEEDCGSVGCAVGHGPYAGLPKLVGEDWFGYSERVFGISNGSLEWQWFFSSYWSTDDNSSEGASKRIQYLISGRPLPPTFGEKIDECEDLTEFVLLYGGIPMSSWGDKGIVSNAMRCPGIVPSSPVD